MERETVFMMLGEVGFYCLSLGIVGTSFLFLFLKNPIRILLSFSLLMIQIAALMMLLDAVFLALLFLIFYTAVMVVFLIFYMTTQNHSQDHYPSLSPWYKGITLLVTSLLAGQIFFVLVYRGKNFFTESMAGPEKASSSSRILGEIVYQDYPLLLVYLSILFFAVFVGIMLIMLPKKIKIPKQTSIEKAQRGPGSIQLRDMKVSEPLVPSSDQEPEN